MCNTVKDKAKNVLKIIYQKLGLAVKNLGLDLDKYIKDVDPSGEYGLKNFFDYNDNKSLNK